MIRVGFLFLLLGAIARAEVPADFEVVIADCVKRQDMNEYGAFHGCWDWHSAAHAHWALFRIALERGSDSDATRWAERSLRGERLAKEKALLEKDPTFENPYGRAWFLRLAVDFEKWAVKRNVAEPKRLRPLAELLVASLFARMEKNEPTPSSREYENASWALAQMHAYLEFVDDSDGRRKVEALVEKHFLVDKPAIVFGQDWNDFFSRFGNWLYLLARTQPRSVVEKFLAGKPVTDEELAVPKYTTDHSLGLVWSRALALRTMIDYVGGEERGRLQRALDAHIALGLANHAKYREQYKAYGHWVTQFGVYALTR